jgi:hypothetical protein
MSWLCKAEIISTDKTNENVIGEIFVLCRISLLNLYWQMRAAAQFNQLSSQNISNSNPTFIKIFFFFFFFFPIQCQTNFSKMKMIDIYSNSCTTFVLIYQKLF